MVLLESLDKEGQGTIVRLLCQGDVVGLEAVIGEPYKHNAIVFESGELCQIPIEVIQNVQKHSPSLCHALMSRWHKSVTQADMWAIELRRGSGKERVIKLLQYLSENSKSNSEFILPSGDDIASMLCVTKETVSRVLASLKRDKILWSLGNGYYEFYLNA
jgi:CRP-like cAMP-binding protein